MGDSGLCYCLCVLEEWGGGGGGGKLGGGGGATKFPDKKKKTNILSAVDGELCSFFFA